MSVKTITLSEDVGQWVEQQAASRQMSADEFVEQLAREARHRTHLGRADDPVELERLLLEAINSKEPAQPADANWWADLHAELTAELQQLNAAKNGSAS